MQGVFHLRYLILLVIAGLQQFYAIADVNGETRLRFSMQTGLFELTHQTMPLVQPMWVFWHDNWQWSGLTLTSQARGDFRYSISGDNQQGGLSLLGSVERAGDHGLRWKFSLKDRLRLVNQWGGLSFSFDAVALSKISANPNLKPTIFPDHSGWSLALGSEQERVEVRFDPPPKYIDYERNNPFEIRVYFNSEGSTVGDRDVSMTVTLPTSGAVEPASVERLAKPDPLRWRSLVVDVARFPIDLSFLNTSERPAGKHGFLKAVGPNLIFEDGQTANFWGTAITSYALFATTHNNICDQARRLSHLGFNLVRIHHHDSAWVQPNIFGANPSNTASLDTNSLKSLDTWIKCLKDEGIYVWMDLHVGRNFTETDGITDFQEIAKGQPSTEVKGFNYVNSSIADQMEAFADRYLGHVNELTGLAYKDDPAIAFILISNENDITNHFGNLLLPDKNVPNHTAIYLEKVREFARANSLDESTTWQSWMQGPPKLFLNDLEHQFNVRMIQHLRNAGVKSLIVTTDFWGDDPMSSLPALTDGDVISIHAYERRDYLSTHPEFQSNIAARVASGAVAGKPLAISEWNIEPFPEYDRISLPIYLAAIGSFQDWNALLEYAYSQSPLNGPTGISDYDFSSDPAMLSTMPVAALLYRQRHLAEGAKPIELAVSAGQLIDQALSAQTSRFLRTTVEQRRVRVVLPRLPTLPWFRPAAAAKDMAVSVDINKSDKAIRSDEVICFETGEVCRDWKRGILTVNSPRSQILAGWIGKKTLRLKDIEASLDPSYCVVAVQSLDGRPIAESDKILVSLAAQTTWSDEPSREVVTEAVTGTLSIRARAGMKLLAVEPRGVRMPIDVSYENGLYKIELKPLKATPWLVLEAEAP